MSRPLVSVCITTYNHERYIGACLQGVLGQLEESQLEILVGDDQSSDGTAALLKQMAARHPSIRHCRHAERMGPARNIAWLVEQARGQFIAHLDGDDFWLPGKLAAQLDYLVRTPDCPAVYANTFCIDDHGVALGLFSDRASGRITARELVRYGNFLNHSSMLYRAEHKALLLRPACNMLDFSMHLNLASAGALGYLQTPLSIYRAGSLTSVLLGSNDLVRELYWTALSGCHPGLVDEADLRAGIAVFMRSVFFRALRSRSPALLRQWWGRALREAPGSRFRLLLGAFWSILRTVLAAARARAGRSLTGNRLQVLYPR